MPRASKSSHLFAFRCLISRREEGKADPDVYPVLGVNNNDTLFNHIREAHEKVYNMILTGEGEVAEEE